VDAEAIIAALGLQPHPEGGWYREIHRSTTAPGTRAAVTSIYFC
jgi:predicted cupin superfamily sugar epimerase